MTNSEECRSIVEKVFKQNGIEWKVKDFGNYIDPKCKTANSIYDKLFRIFDTDTKRESFSIIDSKIDDLLRMTIIVDYDKVVSTIQKLKQRFPDLSGYLQIEEAGYRGVHLNLKIDGLPCEIQLAPKIVVMAVDFLHTLYAKWRSFDFEKELKELNSREQKLLEAEMSEQEKTKQLKILKQEKTNLDLKRKEEQKDFELRKKTYGQIFDIAGFSKFHFEIKSQLDMINSKNEKSTKLADLKLIDILNKNLLTKGELDKSKVKEVANLLSQNISPYQEKFVACIKECLGL